MIFDKVLKSTPEGFLAVNLFPKSCSLAIFDLSQDGVKTLSSTFYSFGENEMLTSVMRSFLDRLGMRSGLKVVFGLPSFWIERESVKPEFERLLLATTEELKLTPLAFVSQTTAAGFAKFKKDPSLTDFYIIEVFGKKILVETFEKGEMIKSKVEDFEELAAVSFGSIFENIKSCPIFVFAKENSFDDVTARLKQFFESQNITPEIFELKPEDFDRGLAVATAFDLGKLPTEEVPPKEPATDFGFLKGKDVGEIEKPETVTGDLNHKRKLGMIFSLIPKIPKINSVDFLKFGKNRTSFIIVGIILILLLSAAGFWFLPSAAIELHVRSSSFNKQFDLKATPAAGQVDSQNQTIPAQVLTSSAEGVKKGVTSGRKLLGEKATGAVTVFNKTTAPKTFSAGTVIIGPSNLKFVLTNSLTVASRSAALEGITYGKGSIKVEAADIGDTSNLPAGTDLNFSDFDSSQYSTHSESAFTGGTSRQVNVVATDDKTRLQDELTKELKDQAVRELIKQAAEKKIDDDAIVAKAAKLQFDKEAGAEANILTLTAKIDFSATAYSVSDVDKVVTTKLKDELPSGFGTWQNSRIDPKVAKVENDGTLRLKVKFSADLVPEFNQNEIFNNITGKSVEKAKNYLLGLSDVQNVNIKLAPKLPGFLGNLPRSGSRIKIEIVAEKNTTE